MKRIDLVFRTVGERTTELALELAQRHIRPNRVHVLENVKPFSEAVERQRRIEHDCDYVVYMDADCLILEDMRPFLEYNDRPYVDCYATDRFRGRIHCGVHITRIDLVRAMGRVEVPEDDMAYVLRPESRLRNLALKELDLDKSYKTFPILHDWFQWHHDIFAKYALRELRSRTDAQRARLAASMATWEDGPEYDVARAAVAHARAHVALDAPPPEVHAYIAGLPEIAERELARMRLPSQGRLTIDEVERERRSNPMVPSAAARAKRPKVFGLGLSRTGTRSLTAALRILGWDTVHYPTDQATFGELARADYRFSLLDHWDGITDITVSPYYAQLDELYPGSKFILTVRDEEGWLRSCKNHWTGRSAFEHADTPERETHMHIRRLLRAAVYGCYDFDEKRFSWAYHQHVRNVLTYFENRPDDLLVIDICSGAGWERLAEFLGVPAPIDEPFPHKGRRMSEKLAELEVQD